MIEIPLNVCCSLSEMGWCRPERWPAGDVELQSGSGVLLRKWKRKSRTQWPTGMAMPESQSPDYHWLLHQICGERWRQNAWSTVKCFICCDLNRDLMKKIMIGRENNNIKLKWVFRVLRVLTCPWGLLLLYRHQTEPHRKCLEESC